MGFVNCYEDVERAEAYSTLEFARTYYLAYRDLPKIIRKHVRGSTALDFGCGTGRSTRFLRDLGFNATGIDISELMVSKARQIDAYGLYQVIDNGDFSQFTPGSYDLVLSVFTFDNIPAEQKLRLFSGLGKLLKKTGCLVSLVSSPEIYFHEWASFSTQDFPENRAAKSGDVVRIVTTDFADRRPAEDILCTDDCYRDIYAQVGLKVVAMHKPLARPDESYGWVSETRIAPWVIYLLRPSIVEVQKIR